MHPKTLRLGVSFENHLDSLATGEIRLHVDIADHHYQTRQYHRTQTNILAHDGTR